MDDWTEEEEAARLAKRFDGDASINQREFAATFGVPGGASMLTQHKKGHRPINLDAALAYAKGFGVSLADISPRLARLVVVAYESLAPTKGLEEGGATEWPLSAELLGALQNADTATRLWAENGARAALRLPGIEAGTSGSRPHVPAPGLGRVDAFERALLEAVQTSTIPGMDELMKHYIKEAKARLGEYSHAAAINDPVTND